MRFGWALLGPALLLAAAGAALADKTTAAGASGEDPLVRAEQAIDASALRAHTRFLASDLLEGRGPGTRGDLLAQAYIAAQFEAFGLRPVGAGGSHLQPFELVGITGAPKTVTARGGKGAATFAYGDEVMLGAGAHRSPSVLENAEVVFVGYGIVAPEYDWDDYKGRDLKGKVLLMMNNDPAGDPASFGGRTRLRYGRWDYKFEIAAKVGAAAAIIIHTTPSAGYPWGVVRTSWAGEQFELPAEGGPRLEVKGFATEAASRKLAALGGFDLDVLRAKAERRDFSPVPLGVRLSTRFDNEVRRVTTANVLGLLPGSDPTLKDEWVVYTAHHDHLGLKPEAKRGEDAIYNGAIDNASGVASMLAIARAFTQLPTPPKRSILFAAVAAEEQGLLGSAWLARNLPRPAGYLAANINIDGMNFRGRTRDLTMIGFGKSSLDDLVVPLAKAQGRTVKPDQLPDRGFFYRSDQYNFARLGVPAVYLASGMDFVGRPPGWGKEVREAYEREHYHQPSDEYDPSWDFSGAVEDTQLFLRIGAAVADAPQMPRWRNGDEFEAIRLRALEAR